MKHALIAEKTCKRNQGMFDGAIRAKKSVSVPVGHWGNRASDAEGMAFHTTQALRAVQYLNETDTNANCAAGVA
jgi:hypothetical protein